MRTKIMVDTEKIASVRAKIEEYQHSYQGAYQRLYELDEELNNTWKGVDSDKFSKLLKGFEGDFKRLDENITHYINFLDKAKNAYDTAQDNITNDAGKLATDYQ